ncbi:conserved hypothetical protein [Pectobacterium parmentieri WPP163]|uniref:hypothetical protein n=1 Tax=Pectobacterium parmentieri TaxID=1905730 RepID=UPI0001B10834|nr:hypothetical protein [Pectobacterium parmentieri]ACX90030.1 conserved hypothetical protein [Pectobacterium parmentieri WPP163]
MSVMPNNAIIVIDISNDVLKLKVFGDSLKEKVKSLGFNYSNEFMVKKVVDEKEKIIIINELVKMDALFSFGYGWYPSEVMAYYKCNGVYSGKYKVISWTSPSEYNIREE